MTFSFEQKKENVKNHIMVNICIFFHYSFKLKTAILIKTFHPQSAIMIQNFLIINAITNISRPRMNISKKHTL